MNCLGDLKEQIWYNQYSIKEYENEGRNLRKISNSFGIKDLQSTYNELKTNENIGKSMYFYKNIFLN